MGSGWGDDSSSRGDWFATRDFSFKNLVVCAGDKLPPAWQRPELTEYLQQQYGKDCIVRRTEDQVRQEMSQQGKAGWGVVGRKKGKQTQ